MTDKERFVGIYNTYITREGSRKLLEWLEGSDFFAAPASTRFHSSFEGGLCSHSLNVYDRLSYNTGSEEILHEYDKESVATVALLHDLCKVNFYTVEMRNAKDETGKWVKVPYYAVDNKFPYGHGEKSVYIISQFMQLTTEEAMAINWHMGGFDDRVKGGSYDLSSVFEQYPLALDLHIADMEATYKDEKRG